LGKISLENDLYLVRISSLIQFFEGLNKINLERNVQDRNYEVINYLSERSGKLFGDQENLIVDMIMKLEKEVLDCIIFF
jgi:hypothetical protein